MIGAWTSSIGDGGQADGPGLLARYALGVAREIEPTRAKPPMLRRVGAGLVLVIAGVIAIHLLLGLIMTVVYVALAIAVVVAIVWAVGTIF